MALMGRGSRPNDSHAERPRRRHPPQPITGFEAFEDDPDAPYYRSQRRPLTPEQTWNAINEELVKLVRSVSAAAQHGPLRVDPDLLCRWHRRLFGKDFYSGGLFRSGPGYYPVVLADRTAGRERQQEGADPDKVRSELASVCSEFNSFVDEAERRGGEVRMRPAALAAIKFYVGILRVHPFEDGNGRLAFAALQAALRSLGMWVVHFGGRVSEHDELLGWALREDREPDYERLVAFLVERMNEAAGQAG